MGTDDSDQPMREPAEGTAEWSRRLEQVTSRSVSAKVTELDEQIATLRSLVAEIGERIGTPAPLDAESILTPVRAELASMREELQARLEVRQAATSTQEGSTPSTVPLSSTEQTETLITPIVDAVHLAIGRRWKSITDDIAATLSRHLEQIRTELIAAIERREERFQEEHDRVVGAIVEELLDGLPGKHRKRLADRFAERQR